MNMNTLRTEIFQWRQKLREHLRAEVRRTVSAPHEIDGEMAHLHQILLDRSIDFQAIGES